MTSEETSKIAHQQFLARPEVRGPLWVLLVVGLLGTITALALSFPVDGALAVARAPGAPANARPVAPHGIVSLELAFSGQRALEIRRAWERPTLPEEQETGKLPDCYVATGADGQGQGSLMPCAKESLELDGWLIVSYTLLLVSAGLLVVGRLRRRTRSWFSALVLPILAAGFDWWENSLLRELLDPASDPTLEAPLLAAQAGFAATVKFALLAVPISALVVVIVAWVYKLLGPPVREPGSGLDDVIAAENDYLVERRRKARVTARERPLGLALSGGGIRSATLNLGILQALARRGVLPRFDYLSTVSGGGYIGSALSSLLSINRARISRSKDGHVEQYSFDGDEQEDSGRPWFSTEKDRFPFAERNEEAMGIGDDELGGSAQMRHLRAAGSFLVGRTQLLSVEMLRVVGGVMVGIFYHLLHFGLFMVVASSFYLWAIYQMVGVRATRFASEAAAPAEASAAFGVLGGPSGAASPLLEQYRQFLGEAFGFAHGLEWDHPFLIAAVIGFFSTALSLAFAKGLLSRLPDDWFMRTGLTLDGSRNFVAALAMVVIMILVGFGILNRWFTAEDPDNLLNVSIPLFSYLGGGVWLGMKHGRINSGRLFRRPHRSRIAAQQGAFIIVTVISLFFVMLSLPFLVFFDPLVEYLEDRPVRSLGSWLATLLGSWILASGSSEKQRQGAMGRLMAKLPGLRRALLSAVVVLAVLGSWLLIAVTIWRLEPEGASEPFRLAVCLVALALFVVSGSALNFNRLSLHYFYRDRLAEAYLRTTRGDPGAGNALTTLRDNEHLRLHHLHGRRRRGRPEECVTGAPYHLLVTCLNLSADERPSQTTRKTDQFVFSRLFCGSDTTGFLETWSYRAGDTQLVDAMTISGAAASPAMGRRSFLAQSVAMTLFNVRLGQWLENPAYKRSTLPRWTFWPGYLLSEILASCDADGRLVYLSDGGHSGDNLGIYPLLKRRCELILAVDAEHDPEYSGNSLVEALRQIHLDEGIEVDIDLSPLRPGADGKPSTAHFVSAPIHYPKRRLASGETLDPSEGCLVVIKSSLTGDEPEMVANYQRNNEPFPHETTGDLFFDDAQFEAYRLLGEHMLDIVLDTDTTCREVLEPGPHGKGAATPRGA